MKTEVLTDWLETSDDLSSASDGDIVGGATVHMDNVHGNTLTAVVTVHTENASLDLIPEWQVSVDDSTWYLCAAADNAASVKLAPHAVSADTDAIVLSLATAIADVDAIVTTLATSDSAVTLADTDLDGAVGAGAIDPARGITIKTSTHTGSYNIVDAITVTGLDVDGNALVGTGTLTQANGNETIEILGSDGQGFASVVSIDLPAMTDTSGAIQVGVGSIVLSGSALDGLIGARELPAPLTVTFNTAAAVGAYATGDVTINGLDADGADTSDTVTITDVDGGESLPTTQTFTQVTRVLIPAQADIDGHITVGMGAGSDPDGELALAANPAVYGWQYARAAVRLSGDNGSANDTYSISYSFRRKRD